MLLIALLAGSFALAAADTPNICHLCGCKFVDGNFSSVKDYVPGLNDAEASGKYLYVNCSDEKNVGELDNINWPLLNVLGVYGNFRKSQWVKLEKIPEYIKNDTVKLSLAENFLPEIDGFDFEGFVRLQSLSLRNNFINGTHSKAFFHLLELRQLDLSQNKLTKLDGYLFYELPLDYLNLSRNHISKIDPDAFRSVASLTILDLSSNDLESVPKEFQQQLQSVRKLFLQGNRFQTLPPLPGNLEVLNIGNNLLDKISLGLETLKQLDVRHNQLSELNINSKALEVIFISQIVR